MKSVFLLVVLASLPLLSLSQTKILGSVFEDRNNNGQRDTNEQSPIHTSSFRFLKRIIIHLISPVTIMRVRFSGMKARARKYGLSKQVQWWALRKMGKLNFLPELRCIPYEMELSARGNFYGWIKFKKFRSGRIVGHFCRLVYHRSADTFSGAFN